MPRYIWVTDDMGNKFRIDTATFADIKTDPPQGVNYRPVTNMYVEKIDGVWKLKVEFDE